MEDIFGIGRSVEPVRAVPQQAWAVDNNMALRRDELLVDVHIISVNQISFNEMREYTGGDPERLCRRVMEIIRKRGKLHNLVTNTGGMLYGTVARMGPDYPNLYGVKPGDEIISLVSLSVTPLKLTQISSVDEASAQLEVEGKAILYSSAPVVKRPTDIPLRAAISAMEAAGSPTCTHQLVQPGQKVLILGAGGRGGLLCGCAARDKLGPGGRLTGIVRTREERRALERAELYDEVLDLDITAVERFSAKASELMNRFDVVVNCINSDNTELVSLVAVKPCGTIFFTSLGCDYKFAALTAESVGKQVQIVPYTGFMEGHAAYTLGLLRRFPWLQGALQPEYQGSVHRRRQRDREESENEQAAAGGHIFCSEKAKAALRRALKAAGYPSNVMIYGESGTGKEIIARVIHQNSERKTSPMVKINCAAIPENLLESELFGYESGSFTGASAKGKKGLWEMAQNGTLFLDEVGELPLFFQAKLLRAIQEKEIVRVGGVTPIKVNARIIAATNRNLTEMVRQGSFREDLYYRLNVYPITMPPLRQRSEDIAPLAQYFVKRYDREFGLKKELSPKAVSFLEKQEFYGNIRELQNLIQRLMISTEDQVIEVRDVVAALAVDERGEGGTEVPEVQRSLEPCSLRQILAQHEESILRAYRRQYGSTRKLAEMLGVSQPSVVRKLKQYGIAAADAAE